jgi:hypothetical protein
MPEFLFLPCFMSVACLLLIELVNTDLCPVSADSSPQSALVRPLFALKPGMIFSTNRLVPDADSKETECSIMMS